VPGYGVCFGSVNGNGCFDADVLTGFEATIRDDVSVSVAIGSLHAVKCYNQEGNKNLPRTARASSRATSRSANTAGSSKHQAVLLRYASDLSAFYRCTFEGYRDMLYAHSLHEFNRDCRVVDTVEFIFGNGAAVFQNCTLLVRLPLLEQKNSATAQGQIDASMATDFAFQFYSVYADVPAR
jgi:pectinesterase